MLWGVAFRTQVEAVEGRPRAVPAWRCLGGGRRQRTLDAEFHSLPNVVSCPVLVVRVGDGALGAGTAQSTVAAGPRLRRVLDSVGRL